MLIEDFVAQVTSEPLDLASLPIPPPTICDVRPEIGFMGYPHDLEWYDEDLRLLHRRLHKFLRGGGSFSRNWRPSGLPSVDLDKYARRTLLQLAFFEGHDQPTFPLWIDLDFYDSWYQDARFRIPLWPSNPAYPGREICLAFDKHVSGVILDQTLFNDWFLAELVNIIRRRLSDGIEIPLDF